MSVHLTILGSGSAGNCAYLESGDTRILIDAGLSGRQIRQRLASIGRSPESLTGVLLTHEHSDHVQGLTALAPKLRLPLYANRFTAEAVQRSFDHPLEWRLFETGACFELGELQIDTFSVPHDAQDPVGFLLRTPAGNIGFLTDLGHATRLVLERVRPSHVLVIEANHDLRLLQEDTRRPWSTKQRILSRHGHLSNDAAAEVVTQIVSDQLRHVYLGHLSRDCNRPELATRAVQDRLNAAGIGTIQVEVSTQDVPSQTLTLG